MRKRPVTPLWLGTLVAIMALLTACNGPVTLGKITFGKQRTPPTVVTVSNSDPTSDRLTSRSQNWAGYTIATTPPAKTPHVTAISATWQVPQVTGPANSDSSTWVGIGGVKNDSLIQAGTDQLMQNGKVGYYAWIELLPALPQPVQGITLLPGDTVTVSIKYESGQAWTISITDKDANITVTQKVTYASCFCSAEWIEEAPSINGQQATLADFTSVTFTNMTATVGGKTAIPTTMCVRPLTLSLTCA
ncbi:MAG: hypothetical protein H0X24_16840, partial [Ktedonobacterales bacterium]|nr:hypothetical protein [Ktedonobacterales bacterium]